MLLYFADNFLVFRFLLIIVFTPTLQLSYMVFTLLYDVPRRFINAFLQIFLPFRMSCLTCANVGSFSTVASATIS